MKSVLAAALLIGVTAPAADPPRGAFERTVAVARPGRVVITLDRDVYERARRDLGDLRVFDDGQRQVPYLIEAAREAVEAGPRRPHVLNRSFVREKSSSLTLDFGAPVLKSELALSLSGDNFRRRVAVEGRNKHEAAWETLTDGAYVFAVPPPWAARYETVPLPENNFQFLRVTVFDGPDDTEPVDIREAWARPAGEAPSARAGGRPAAARRPGRARARDGADARPGRAPSALPRRGAGRRRSELLPRRGGGGAG